MKTDYQNKDMGPSLDEAAVVVKAAKVEYSFPQHGITVMASTLEEAYVLLEKQLQANVSKE